MYKAKADTYKMKPQKSIKQVTLKQRAVNIKPKKKQKKKQSKQGIYLFQM